MDGNGRQDYDRHEVDIPDIVIEGVMTSSDIEDFRQRVVEHAKVAVGKAPKIESEASTNAYLVQPFLVALGYDVTNPDQVSLEHHADFATKYQNKVDYAILYAGKPVIAIESKKVGSAMKDDQGQLRSYFNACPTVKLGILTDGLKFEFYADSDKPNMMDEVSFLKLDLANISKVGAVDDLTLSGLAKIRSGQFNPENVGAEAKRKLLLESIVGILRRFKAEPPDEFVKFMLDQANVTQGSGRLTQRIVDANRDVVRESIEAFVAEEALARLGYAPKDVVRTTVEPLEQANAAPHGIPAEMDGEPLQPSELERATLTYVRHRLYYLARDEMLFAEVAKLTYKKSGRNFRVYYAKPNSGSILDVAESKDGQATLRFPALSGREVADQKATEFDECLIESFRKRVLEAGVKLSGRPNLQPIPGGRSSEVA